MVDTRLEALTQRYKAEVEAFLTALDTGTLDAGSIAEEAHKTAGSAAAFGHDNLRAALVAVETAAETGDDSALGTAIAQARIAWDTAPPPRLG